MTKRRITNLMIAIVCAVLVLPLTFSLFSAKALPISDINKYAYYGVDFNIETQGEVKAASTNVKIEVLKDETGAESVLVYENGSIKTDGVTEAGIVFTSYTNGVATLRIAKPGDYTVTFTTTQINPAQSQSCKVRVLNDIENEKFVAPSYKNDFNRAEYQKKIDDATFVQNDDDTAEKESLRIGDTYKVPSVEDYVNCGSFAYSLYKKVVYYSAPGSSTYSSSSATANNTLSFSISKIGGYRFYVILSLDQIDGKSFSMTTENTVEREDGFYLVKEKVSGVRLYVEGSGDDVKYYTDEDFENEYLGEVDFELVVPVFEFNISNAGPKITIKTSYQEKGYIGLQYTVKSISVSGTDLETTYTLMYSATGKADDWQEATEDYNYSTGKFTPEKQGYYKVKVHTVDAYGLEDSQETAVITVTEKLKKVEYQTSFKNWLSVNKVPFIFLCVSAGCLLLILVIVFVPTKVFVSIGGFFTRFVKRVKSKKQEEIDDDEE